MSTSRSLNKVMLIGNLTRDPVIRVTTNGSVVCTFGLATNSTWKDSKGNIQERTEFHNIVAWNKLGEICAQLLSTGMAIYVEGELRTRTWDDNNNGVKHFRTEIKLQDMKLQDDKDKKGVGIDSAKKSGEKFAKDDIEDETVVPAEVVAEETPSDIKQDGQDGEDLF
jgi:single-strand DNA-binding protein